MAIDYLSIIINQVSEHNYWTPFQHKSQNFKVCHLLFADDVLLFAKIDPKSVQTIKAILDHLCLVSGMEINFEKFKLWLSQSIPPNTKDNISNFLQIPTTTNLGSYLGYQLKTNYTNVDFNKIVLSLQQKLQKWKVQHLSFAGRLQLISSTMNQIPNYYYKVFSLPKKIHDKIDKININFLWGHSQSKKKLHLINWDIITKPKKLGGLDIRKSDDSNSVFMAKLIWDLETGKYKLWTIFSRQNIKIQLKNIEDLPFFSKSLRRIVISSFKTFLSMFEMVKK